MIDALVNMWIHGLTISLAFAAFTLDAEGEMTDPHLYALYVIKTIKEKCQQLWRIVALGCSAFCLAYAEDVLQCSPEQVR